MIWECCRCPMGLEPYLDRRVEVATKCGLVKGVLRAIGETFLEVQEEDPKFELTIIQCAKVCWIRLLG